MNNFVPSVHIPDPANPNFENADLVVIGGTIKSAVPVPFEYIIEPLVTFYPDQLKIFLDCEFPGCQGHFKYGIMESRNLPVIFGNHKKDVAYYYAFVTKATLPFEVPRVGHKLMDGIKWYSATPRDGQKGVDMSCMIDGLLMDFKIRILDLNFCANCLFISKEGMGRAIERVIRSIMHYIYVVADPEPTKDGFYQVVKSFSYEQQLFIKRMWIDRLYEGGELQETVRWSAAGMNRINDLLYDPANHKMPMLTRLSMYRYVLENLQPISWYFSDVTCGCGTIIRKPLQCLRYMAIPLPRGRFLLAEPAYRTFNPNNLEFDDDYWSNDYEEEDFSTHRLERNLSKRIQGRQCARCNQQTGCLNTGVPETTWMLVVEVPVYLRLELMLSELTPSLIHSGASFDIAYVVLMTQYSHFVSIHLLDGVWYFFDDSKGATGGQPCPFTRLDKRDFRNHRRNYTMERVFYLRSAEKKPHRCLTLAHQSDMGHMH